MKLILASLLLGWTKPAFAQPIIHEGYPSEIFTRPTASHLHHDRYVACYSEAFKTPPDSPATAQHLAMFTDKWVEHNGRVFTSKSDQSSGLPNQVSWTHNAPNGLWELISGGVGDYDVDRFYQDIYHRCVHFKLLLMADNVGQVVASPQPFGTDPIQIIAVDQVTNDIYGYYEEGSLWKKKTTKWKPYAADGTLMSGAGAEVAGLTTNGRLFHLWGEFDVAKHDHIQCAAPPASIGDWTGFWSGSRGLYCPRASNNQLTKWTWHGSGPTTDELDWVPASKITRLSSKSNIYGVATNGDLQLLWHEKGVAVHSASITHLPSIKNVRAVGGLDDEYARGVFVSNGDDKVYNVYYEDGWKEKEIAIKKEAFDLKYDSGWKYEPLDVNTLDFSAFFGARNGITYLLHGWSWDTAITTADDQCKRGTFYLTRFNFVGGTERYTAVVVNVDKSIMLCGTTV